MDINVLNALEIVKNVKIFQLITNHAHHAFLDSI